MNYIFHEWATTIGKLKCVPTWDRTHDLNLQGSYQFPMGLTIGMTANGRTGLPYDRYFWNDFENGYTNRQGNRGTTGRTPDVWSANVRVAYEHKLAGRQGRVGGSADIFNVTNNRKVTGYQSSYLNRDNELRPAGRLDHVSGRMGLYYKF